MSDEKGAAIQTLEYARGYGQAWREWSACADVPNPRDREFLERARVQMGERSSEAVRVLRQFRAAPGVKP
jgi:hypothetical protein